MEVFREGSSSSISQCSQEASTIEASQKQR